ncbi:MAG: DUF2442 domain-containing protein [Leptospiraceae bacterium]|nr:DUF2442 domain-containing protein [Leptospiraceae bacterium]MBK7056428.1 DUF2442 domain-containing protein [Leptospiraceae bacterium]MBK9498408.1 DUF2442 domain-containing protein [Leptospiraceae bacterium]MBL0265074.1 DUF2442 domain-containing protein [Leptospiraceae bacterium]
MNTLQIEALAQKIWFDKDNMFVSLKDGRSLSIHLVWFPRLNKATIKQRKNYRLLGDGEGINWEDIDEDISVSGLLLGKGDMTKKRFY